MRKKAEDKPAGDDFSPFPGFRHREGPGGRKPSRLKMLEGPPLLPCPVRDEAVAKPVPPARVSVDLGNHTLGSMSLERLVSGLDRTEVKKLGRRAKDGPEVIALEDADTSQLLEVGEALEKVSQAAWRKNWVCLPLISMDGPCFVSLRGQARIPSPMLTVSLHYSLTRPRLQQKGFPGAGHRECVSISGLDKPFLLVEPTTMIYKI